MASLAKRYGELVYLLPPTGGYRLGDPSTPDEIVSQVLEAAKRGDKVTVAWIEDLIRAAKSKAKPADIMPDEAAADIATRVLLELQPPLIVELQSFLKNARASRKKVFLIWLETQKTASPHGLLRYLPAA